METVLDLPNVLAVLFTKERRHIPRITGYAKNVVPAYPLDVFKDNFLLCRGTFETLSSHFSSCRRQSFAKLPFSCRKHH